MSRRAKVTLTVCAGVFMASLDLFIVNIAFPQIQRDFGGSSLASLSWVLNAYAIGYAALLVPAGRWADRAGRKRAFLAGLWLFSAASAACAAAPSVAVLVAARVAQAVGSAMLLPTSLGLLLPEYPPSKRGAAVGIWAAVGGVAAAAGPPVGGLLVQAGWRWVFIVNVPVAAVAIVAAIRTLREERDETATGMPDLLGAGLLTVGVGALTAALVEGPVWGWDSPRILGLFAAAAVMLAVFARRTLHHPLPVIEPELLRVRTFVAANLSALAFFAGFGAMLLGGVLFLTRVWGEDVLTAGLMIAPGPLMAATFSVVGARLIDRIGHRAVAMLGGLAFAAGSVYWASQMSATADYVSDFLPGFLVGGIGVGLVIPTLSGAAVAALPPQRFATGSGVFGMSRQLGSALGVALLVAVIGTPAPAEAVDAFREGTYLVIAGGLLTALAAAFMGTVRVAAPAWRSAEQAA